MQGLLSELVDSPVALLLGAGASQPLGLPDDKRLFKMVMWSLKGGEQKEEWDRWLGRMYNCKLASSTEEVELLSADPLAYVLNLLEEGSLANQELSRQLKRALVTEFASGHFRGDLTPDRPDQIKGLYQPLFDLLCEQVAEQSKKGRKKSLPVFSPNWDINLESFSVCCQEYQVNNGTREYLSDLKRWDSENYKDRVGSGKKGILLFKLHGSMFWYRQDGGILQSKTVPEGEPVAVLPGLLRDDTPRKEPFKTCYGYFHEYCHRDSASILVVIGCSLREPRLREFIWQGLWKGLQLLVFSGPEFYRDSDRLFNVWGFPVGRAKAFPKLFGIGEEGTALVERLKAELEAS